MKPVINENALKVLEKRYLAKDEQGNLLETPEDMFRRVAKTVAYADAAYGNSGQVEIIEQRFYDLMAGLYFLPNSPTLMNAGRPLGQLSACFVLPVEDSMEAIFEAVKNAALIHKSGGGTGFSFSRLRPSGSPVNSTGGVASGPISFMKVFNTATEAVKQGGTRRGANMGILRIDHPDIMEFIDCKKDNADITNFNISVGLTEEFMNAVYKGEEYDLIDPHTKNVAGSLNAEKVFEHIVDAAWRNGEPGIIFLDRLNRDNVVPGQGEIESTNPCGEQPLLPYESCNLGSINLAKTIKYCESSAEVDWEILGDVVADAVHFLDNVIDMNNFPLKQIHNATTATRKIGLGVMGFADMLLLLGIPYNSDEALELAEKIMEFITRKGREASAELAKKRGPFPLFEESTLSGGPLMRNATITTIAPTGTLSMIAGCSSGVEPVFAYAYIRNIMDNTEMIETNEILQQELHKIGMDTQEIMLKISMEGGVAHLEELPEDLRRVFVCAHDVSPLYHIKMQAAFQKYTDNAVSKTVNFPSDATREDVAEVYRLAFEQACKGVTIYRDGSRDSQVLNIGSVDCAKQDKEMYSSVFPETANPYGTISPRPRPEITSGFTERMKIGCGNLYVTINYDSTGICEVFTSTGKAGGCPSQSEATARLCSVALRSGMSVHEIYNQLKGIRCPSTIRQDGMSCTSCPDAIAKVLIKVNDFIEAGNPVASIEPEPVTNGRKNVVGAAEKRNTINSGKVCPDCGHELEHEGGCILCRGCGYSKCN